jgi:hypothetical protein
MMPFSFFIGLLLMTLLNSSPGVSSSENGNTILLTDFTSASSDLGWYFVNENVMKDREMVLVTLLDNAVSTAEGRELTTGAVNTARATLGIRSRSFAVNLVGKDGSVKLSEETAIPMREIYSLVDTPCLCVKEKSLNANRDTPKSRLCA